LQRPPVVVSNGKSQQQLCPDQLVDAVAEFGRTARVPMLWIYTRNDSYFGPDLSKRMAEAFRAAGGNVEYHLLPDFRRRRPFFDRLGRMPFNCGAPIVSEFLAKTSVKGIALWNIGLSVCFGKISPVIDSWQLDHLWCSWRTTVMRVDAQQLVPFGDVPATENFTEARKSLLRGRQARSPANLRAVAQGMFQGHPRGRVENGCRTTIKR